MSSVFSRRGIRGRSSFCANLQCVNQALERQRISLPPFDGTVDVHESVKKLPLIEGIRLIKDS